VRSTEHANKANLAQYHAKAKEHQNAEDVEADRNVDTREHPQFLWCLWSPWSTLDQSLMAFVVHCRRHRAGHAYEDEVSDGSRHRASPTSGAPWVELMLTPETRTRLRESDPVRSFAGGNGRKSCNWGSYRRWRQMMKLDFLPCLGQLAWQSGPSSQGSQQLDKMPERRQLERCPA
jgi:hypothetical protein